MLTQIYVTTSCHYGPNKLTPSLQTDKDKVPYQNSQRFVAMIICYFQMYNIVLTRFHYCFYTIIKK